VLVGVVLACRPEAPIGRVVRPQPATKSAATIMAKDVVVASGLLEGRLLWGRFFFPDRDVAGMCRLLVLTLSGSPPFAPPVRPILFSYTLSLCV
jgi:hypothetical protein